MAKKPKIYLISPPKINIKTFPTILTVILKAKIVSIFQLRLKDYSDNDLLKISETISEICNHYKVTFILNDRVDIAKKINIDGVHLGKNDLNIKQARKILGRDKIIGSSCYNKISLSIKSENLGSNYQAFGAFFKTTTKSKTTNITLSSIHKYRKHTNNPIVGIGGLNKNNITKLKFLKLDFLAFCSAVWYGKHAPLVEIKKINNVIESFNLN